MIVKNILASKRGNVVTIEPTADLAVAVTGIAGPGGGTPEKPVGTVFIAFATPSGVEVKKHLNVWERATFKQVTATQALEMLRRRLISA